MKTKKFMNVELEAIKKTVEKKLPNEFDSHDFIKRFAKDFEQTYIELLSKYKSIRTAHRQIANSLRRNMEDLKIQKNGEIMSMSFFGNNVPNKKWIKID